MSYGDYILQNFKADLFLDSKNTRQSHGRFKLHNLRVAEKAFSDLSFIWAGDFKKYRLHIDFVYNSIHGELKFDGRCHQDSCKLKANSASFDLKKHERWDLIDPVNLLLSYGEIKPFKACWAHKKSNVCMQGSWNDQAGWKLEGVENHTPLREIFDMLNEFFKEEHLGWEKTS
jgi:hypothetical protein